PTPSRNPWRRSTAPAPRSSRPDWKRLRLGWEAEPPRLMVLEWLLTGGFSEWQLRRSREHGSRLPVLRHGDGEPESPRCDDGDAAPAEPEADAGLPARRADDQHHARSGDRVPLEDS